jgi:hypothetical protein
MNPDPKVLEVESIGGDVLVTFDNGKSAIYPAAHLWSTFSQLEPLEEDHGESF